MTDSKLKPKPIIMVSAALLMNLISGALHADAPLRNRAVDVLILTDGTRILGTRLNPQDDSAFRLLVRKQWLETEHPEFLRFISKAKTQPATNQQPIQKRLADHIRQLEQTVPHQLERIGFLKERLTRLTPDASEDSGHEAIILEISSHLVRRQFDQKPQIRKIGELAILNRLNDVETRSATDLKSELDRLAAGTKLVTELPGDATDSAEDEFLRILIHAEYLFGNRCRLIQHGGQYFDSDRQKADLAGMLPGILQAELQNQLQQLLAEPGLSGVKTPGVSMPSTNPGSSLDSAAATLASDRDARLVEVTQLQIDPQRATARVQIRVFYGKTNAAANWTQVHHLQATASAADIAPGQEQQIANDPGVRQITQLFQTLGAGGQQLKTAFAAAAVVQSAQNAAQQQLTNWLTDSGNESTRQLRVATTQVTKLP